jgi:hypothetical protein
VFRWINSSEAQPVSSGPRRLGRPNGLGADRELGRQGITESTEGARRAHGEVVAGPTFFAPLGGGDGEVGVGAGGG